MVLRVAHSPSSSSSSSLRHFDRRRFCWCRPTRQDHGRNSRNNNPVTAIPIHLNFLLLGSILLSCIAIYCSLRLSFDTNSNTIHIDIEIPPAISSASLSSSSSSSSWPSSAAAEWASLSLQQRVSSQQQQQRENIKDDKQNHDFFYPPSNQIKPFKFYVYENLSEEYLPYNISQCIKRKIGGGDENDIEKNPPPSCSWGLEQCVMEDVRWYHLLYIRHRTNYNADVVQADLFLRYPLEDSSTTPPTVTSFATRTSNPHDADIFIVPYPHDSHCKCNSKRTAPGCYHGDSEKVMPGLVTELLDEQLLYYNQTTQNRHLFLSGSNWENPLDLLRGMPLRTTKGEAYPCRRDIMTKNKIDANSAICGNIVAATHRTLPEYQPTSLNSYPEEWWTARPRKYSLSGIFGRQPNNSTYRNIVLDRAEELFPPTIGGLPTYIQEILGKEKKGTKEFGSHRTVSQEREMLEVYQNSTFCLILPGDIPPGNRVYDTIMSGCIPVFLVFKRDEYPYWFQLGKNAVANRVVYPYAKGIFWDDTGIDYESMVVQVDYFGECGLECITPTLEKLMANSSEMTRLRKNLRKHAALFSYGIQENSYQTFDAFGVLLWQLGNYAHRLSIQERKKT